MGLIRIGEDIGNTLNTVIDSYKQYKEGNVQDAAKNLVGSNMIVDFSVYGILPLILSLVTIIFSLIACCYMCCCNPSKKYKKAQSKVDFQIKKIQKELSITTKKHDDVYAAIKQNNAAAGIIQDIDSQMEVIRTHQYKKAKRCNVCSIICLILYMVLAVVYIAGLLIMFFGAQKIGKLGSSETQLVTSTINDVLTIANTYQPVIDESLIEMNFTTVQVLKTILEEEDETQFKAKMNTFFTEVKELEPVTILVNALQKLSQNDENNDLSTIIRQSLYYQTVQDGQTAPEYIATGQNTINQITDGMSKTDQYLTDADDDITTLKTTITKFKGIFDQNMIDFDVPTLEEMLTQAEIGYINDLIQQLIDTTTSQRLQRVMLQIKNILLTQILDAEDPIVNQLINQFIPWYNNTQVNPAGNIESTQKFDIIQLIKDIFGIDISNLSEEYLSEILSDENIEQYINAIYAINQCLLDAKILKEESFNEIMEQVTSYDCNYFWCSLVDSYQYNQIMDKAEKIPVLKIDRTKPDSIFTCVSTILALLILIIPLIYIILVLCCGTLCPCQCCSCWTIAFMPWCGLIVSVIMLVTLVISVPGALINPIYDTITTDINELGSIGDPIYQEYMSTNGQDIEHVTIDDNKIYYTRSVERFENYISVYDKDGSLTTSVTANITELNLTNILSFPYTAAITLQLEDKQLDDTNQLYKILIDLFPNLANIVQVPNEILDEISNEDIDLNMSKSTINKLFANEQKSIVGLVKFGDKNIGEIISNYLSILFDNLFNKELSQDQVTGIIKMIQINKNEENVNQLTEDFTDLLGFDLTEIKTQLNTFSFKQYQCTVESANDQMTEAKAFRDNTYQTVTLFDDITAVLDSSDLASYTTNAQNMNSNLNAVIPDSDAEIKDMSLKTLQALYANILDEYKVAQNQQFQFVPNTGSASEALYTATQTTLSKATLTQEDLANNVIVTSGNPDVVISDGFQGFLNMALDDTHIADSGCIKQADVNMNEITYPTWFLNIIQKRGISESTDNMLRRTKLYGYCQMIDGVRSKLNTLQAQLNITSGISDLHIVLLNMDTYITELDTNFQALKTIIDNFNKDIFGYKFGCNKDTKEGIIVEDYTQTQGNEYLARNVDAWIQRLIKSVINNIFDGVSTTSVFERKQLPSVLVTSDIFDALPNEFQQIINNVVKQFVNDNTIVSTKTLNTPLTFVQKQINVISDPFVQLSIGIYLTLLFMLFGVFVSCCSYKQIYLRRFEHQRKRKLGVANPYLGQSTKQANQTVETTVSSTVVPIISTQEVQDQTAFQQYQPIQPAVSPEFDGQMADGALEYDF